MSSKFYEDLFEESLNDLGHEPMQWYGIIANPASAGVVPVVASKALGLLPSPTFARQLVLATTDTRLVIAFHDEYPEADLSYRDEGKLEYDGELSAVMRTAPAPVLAAVGVALQILAVEIGREWINAGHPPRRLRSLWTSHPYVDESASDWVPDRWDRWLTERDTSLSPTRLLGRSRTDLQELVNDLLRRICAITVAVFDEQGYRFQCLTDPFAPSLGSEAPISTLTASLNRRWTDQPPLQAPAGDPWRPPGVGPDEPPF